MINYVVEKVRKYSMGSGIPNKILYERQFEDWNKAKQKGKELKISDGELSDGTIYWEEVRVAEIADGEITDYPYMRTEGDRE